MFKNHIKVAWRNLMTHRLFSVINILGLSMGLSIVLLLFLYIAHERSFDNFHSKKDRIHRVLLKTDENYNFATWASVPPVTGPTIQEEVSNVAAAARLLKHNFGRPASLGIDQQNFTEEFFYWVDRELLEIFDVPLIEGDPATALDRPGTVILSEKAAKRYFKDTDPMGRTIKVDNTTDLEVTGIYRDFPRNSTLDAEVMASSNGSWFWKNETWSNASFVTYLLLKDQVSLKGTQAQIDQMLDGHLPKEEQWYGFALQPLPMVHLHSTTFENGYTSRVGDIQEIRNLGYLALLILLIACINYMNLTTARSQKRAKEVGVSKTLGATSGSLVGRFYVETGLITALAILLGIGLATLALPSFNALTGQALGLELFISPRFILVFLLVWATTTLISGLYPSLYLSHFRPKEILSPGQKHGKGNVLVRQGLVIVQFAASTALIVGVLVIYQQTRYIQNKNLGFNAENVLAISVSGLGGQNMEALEQEIGNRPEVSSVAFAQGYPGMGVSGRTLKKKPSDLEFLNINTNVADPEIVEVLKLDLLAGRGLPENKGEKDSLVEVVLNKTAVDFLGYSPQEAIGKEVNMGKTYTVAGVVADFNYESLHRPIGAYAFHNNPSEAKSFMLVRLHMGDLARTMDGIKETFARVAPNLDFNHSFLDQNLEKLYRREQRAAKISIVFCLLAIFVAAMGLFGLAAYTAEQRRKEIGIRKVLGASVSTIGRMLSKDFAKLVLLALLIGFPMAYLAMENWLEGFAYRVELEWWVFALAGALALGIAMITISFQSIRAAMTDPAKSLRSE